MIDRDRMTELEDEIGPEDLAMILSVYLSEAQATLDRIAGGLSGEEHDRAIHFLRSGALNMGLRGLADQAERSRRTADAADLRATLERTRAELARVAA